MTQSVSSKSARARVCEAIVFVLLIPAFLFLLLFSTSGGDIFILVGSPPTEMRLSLFLSAEDFLRLSPEGDISYQLKLVVDYLNEGIVADWVLNLWPPGMPAIYFSILQLSGSDNFPLKIIAVATIVYVFSSYAVYRSLAQKRFSPSYLVASALPLLFITFENSIFRNLGPFSSDFFCFALLGFLLSVLFQEKPKTWKQLVLLAILLASLAYLRTFYFVLIKVLTAGGLLVLAMYLASVTLRWVRGTTTFRENTLGRSLASFGGVLLLTWVLLAPWKAYLIQHEKAFDWTFTDQVWAAQWRNDLPGFLVGMNTPCLLETEICAKLMPFQHADTWATPVLGSDFYKRLSIMTFVFRPLDWYDQKAQVFRYFWFDGQELKVKLPVGKRVAYFQSWGLLLLAVGLAIACVFRVGRNAWERKQPLENNETYFLFFCFVLFNFMLFTFVHYEPRYSIPLKWVTYLFSLFALRNVIVKIDQRLLGAAAFRWISKPQNHSG